MRLYYFLNLSNSNFPRKGRDIIIIIIAFLALIISLTIFTAIFTLPNCVQTIYLITLASFQFIFQPFNIILITNSLNNKSIIFLSMIIIILVNCLFKLKAKFQVLLFYQTGSFIQQILKIFFALESNFKFHRYHEQLLIQVMH